MENKHHSLITSNRLSWFHSLQLNLFRSDAIKVAAIMREIRATVKIRCKKVKRFD